MGRRDLSFPSSAHGCVYPHLVPSHRILSVCDVQLYRQMGGLRDDLFLHERSVDMLIELLKKEKVRVCVLCCAVCVCGSVCVGVCVGGCVCAYAGFAVTP